LDIGWLVIAVLEVKIKGSKSKTSIRKSFKRQSSKLHQSLKTSKQYESCCDVLKRKLKVFLEFSQYTTIHGEYQLQTISNNNLQLNSIFLKEFDT
jgi:hypothetical protein